MVNILIIYYSSNGSTKKMARLIARGVEMVEGVTSVIRTVNNKNDVDGSDVVVEKSELKQCSGLIIGSPTHFGNMASPLKEFIDTTTAEWFNGDLTGKPAGVFTSTSSLHGGQETTLLSMMLPLLHLCGHRLRIVEELRDLGIGLTERLGQLRQIDRLRVED